MRSIIICDLHEIEEEDEDDVASSVSDGYKK
jgi:hypothetical protein